MKVLTKDISRFTQDDFGSAFRQNLRAAESTVVIVSPFIRLKRLNFWLPEFVAAIKRGVRICVFLQKPVGPDDDDNMVFELNQQPIEEFNDLVNKLQSRDVHVILRPKVHQKIAVIDGKTVWEGSLNVLSYTGMTQEQMLRMECTDSAEWMINCHRLHCPQCKTKSDSQLEWFGKQFAKCREALGLNQHQLASLLGISRSSITQLESGRWNVELDTLIEFSEIMGFEIGFGLKRVASNIKAAQGLQFPHNPNMSHRERIGWRLKMHRKQKRLRQDGVVSELDISRTELSCIENGKRNTNVSRLASIAAALGLLIVLVPKST
jgi:transcriptional regulator with XRE-family HTH domain